MIPRRSPSAGWWFGLACILLPTSAPASTAPVEGWFAVETENFRFYGTQPDTLVEMSRDLENTRALYMQVFPQAAHTAPPTFLFVFTDENAFSPYSLGRGGAGYFQPHDDAHFGAVLVHGDGGSRAVRRQYLHNLVRANSEALPLWLRHGLVEVYTHSDIQDGRARVGLPLLFGNTVTSVRVTDGMTLAEVLAAERFPEDQIAASSFVELSWRLAHYLLIEDPERRQTLSQFVARRGTEPITILQQLGTTVEALDAQLLEYHGRFQDWPIWIAPEPAASQAEPRTTALGEARALARLADLLLHTGDERRSATKDHAERALALDANESLALAVLGRVRHLDGDPAAACELLRRAGEHQADRFAPHYWHGLAELDAIETGGGDSSTRVTAAVEALRRAVSIDAQRADAWARLGYALTLADPPSEEAVDALVRARQMLPERGSIALHLTLAHARLGNEDEAQAVVAELERQSLSEGTLVQAREIVYQMVFKRAVALARDGELDAAIERFDQVAAGTTNEMMRAQAEANAIKMRRRLELQRR